jgi:hypothetical protein
MTGRLPTWVVNPGAVDLPAVKHQAALRGISVVASVIVPPDRSSSRPGLEEERNAQVHQPPR